MPRYKIAVCYCGGAADLRREGRDSVPDYWVSCENGHRQCCTFASARRAVDTWNRRQLEIKEGRNGAEIET